MDLSEKLDRLLIKGKGIGPYTLCLGACWMGLNMVRTASQPEIPHEPGLLVVWTGAVLCLLSVSALATWHIWQWPPWFALGVAIGKPERVTKAQGRRKAASK